MDSDQSTPDTLKQLVEQLDETCRLLEESLDRGLCAPEWIASAVCDLACEDLMRVVVSLVECKDYALFVKKLKRHHHEDIPQLITEILKHNRIVPDPKSGKIFALIKSGQATKYFLRESIRVISGRPLTEPRDEFQYNMQTLSRDKITELAKAAVARLKVAATEEKSRKWKWITNGLTQGDREGPTS